MDKGRGNRQLGRSQAESLPRQHLVHAVHFIQHFAGNYFGHEILRIALAVAHAHLGGRIWIRIFPDKPISQKPAEVRMGNGKGNPEYFVAEIVPGKVLYEMDGVDEVLARQAFRLAAAKLPIATAFVHRLVG